MNTNHPSAQPNRSWDTRMKDLWATRPYRLPDEEGGNAIFAGVCEGIAVRYQVDPTLIRVLLALISIFGLGSGFFIYFLCYLIFPLPSTKRSPWEDILDGHGSFGAWAALILLVLVSLGSAGSSAVLSLVAMLILFWFLYERQPYPPTSPGSEAAISSDVPLSGDPHHRTPPAWDPLGTAPFAWDLPEPGPRPEEGQSPSSHRKLWKIILGAAAVVGIVTVGLGSLIFSWNVAHHFSPSLGDQTITVNQVDGLASHYESSVGDLSLDLTNLPALDKDTTITIKSGVGDVDLYLPKTVPVEVNCAGGIGDRECGVFPAQDASNSAKLTVDLNSAVGDFSVHPPQS
ncbi:PspC domain-containing protein [Corynebacterium sp. 3HC-13]|uniref:PspC domain-containing protein n=1 Tax=Corynebacterium poyangense TaxID=2684405 RepID=UPI001CC9DF55|nr:PspC domain-containing protein [Corynebacterium poyangense]MBZ8176786.1 PspC domain-containing protein [Corynebacterium poyangense]